MESMKEHQLIVAKELMELCNADIRFLSMIVTDEMRFWFTSEPEKIKWHLSDSPRKKFTLYRKWHSVF